MVAMSFAVNNKMQFNSRDIANIQLLEATNIWLCIGLDNTNSHSHDKNIHSQREAAMAFPSLATQNCELHTDKGYQLISQRWNNKFTINCSKSNPSHSHSQ